MKTEGEPRIRNANVVGPDESRAGPDCYKCERASSTHTAPVPPSSGRADTNAVTADVRRNTLFTRFFSAGPRCPERNPLP